jgi:hypothetical protein
VENLWMASVKPVEILTAKFICACAWNDLVQTTCRCAPSCPASLDRAAAKRRIDPRFVLTGSIHTVIVHRFEETIGGRPYQIEATPVGDRWRAQLRRGPGVPTAMMPFYGRTPDEAAGQLTQWLALAHKRVAGNTTPTRSTV